MKRLYVRLAIVGATLLLGTYAIVQSMGSTTQVAESGEPDPNEDEDNPSDPEPNNTPDESKTSPAPQPPPPPEPSSTKIQSGVVKSLRDPTKPLEAKPNPAIAQVFQQPKSAASQPGSATVKSVTSPSDGGGFKIPSSTSTPSKVVKASAETEVKGSETVTDKQDAEKIGVEKLGAKKTGTYKFSGSPQEKATTTADGFKIPQAEGATVPGALTQSGNAGSVSLGDDAPLANTSTGAQQSSRQGGTGGYRIPGTTSGSAAAAGLVAGAAGAAAGGAAIKTTVDGAATAAAGGSKIVGQTSTPPWATTKSSSPVQTGQQSGANGLTGGSTTQGYNPARYTTPATQGTQGKSSGYRLTGDNGASTVGGNPTTSLTSQSVSNTSPAVGGYNPPTYNPTQPGSSPTPLGYAAESLSSATPGDVKLEGMQAPALSIVKSAPAEVQVNKEATFRVVIKNRGQATAHAVRVRDQVPRGTRFVRSNPQPASVDGATLVWQLGDVDPGDEQSIEITLVPTEEGEIGSVATVDFRARAAVRTVSTRPELVIQQKKLDPVLIGQIAEVEITIQNTGSGDATNVVLEANLPDMFEHPAGRELENLVGDIAPGDTKKIGLQLAARKKGLGSFDLQIKAGGLDPKRSSQSMEVTAPELALLLKVPSKRYLGRNATCSMTVQNPGTATARNIAIAARLPQGLEFVSTEGNGQYIPQQHAILWSLAELAPNASEKVSFRLKTSKDGKLPIKFEATGDLNLTYENERSINVESVPEVVFTINDTEDPIEIGSDTTYEINVENRGTLAAEKVDLLVVIPNGMQFGSASGPSGKGKVGQQNSAEGPIQYISFPSIAKIRPKEKMVFKITLKGTRAGNQILRAQLSTNRVQPVVKEESTHVYQEDEATPLGSSSIGDTGGVLVGDN